MGFWSEVLEALKIVTTPVNSGNGDTAYVGGNKINQSFLEVGNKIDTIQTAATALNAHAYRNIFLNPAFTEEAPYWLYVLNAINYSITNFYGGTVTCTVNQKIVFVLIKNVPDPNGSPVGLMTREYYALRSGALSVSLVDTVEDITPYGSFTDAIVTDGDVDGFLIYLDDIDDATIEGGFNASAAGPFDMVPGMFVSALQLGDVNLYYWQGPAGNFGTTGTDGPAIADYFFYIEKSGPPRENIYLNMAAMYANQINQTTGFFQFVRDASAHSGVIAGSSYFEKLATNTEAEIDYRLLIAQEIIGGSAASPFLSAIKYAGSAHTLNKQQLNRFVQFTAASVTLTISDTIVELAADVGIFSLRTVVVFEGTGAHKIITPDAVEHNFIQGDIVNIERGKEDSDKWYVYKNNTAGGGNIFFDYLTPAAMIAAQASQSEQTIYVVEDASTDVNITFPPAETKLWAQYRYLGTINGDITDYQLISAPYSSDSRFDEKENTSNKSTSIETDKTSNVKYPSVKAVYDWAVGLFATIANLALKAPLASPTFTGVVTAPTFIGQLTGTASNSSNLNNLNSTQFLRSDVNASFSGNLNSNTGLGRTITLYDNNSSRNNRIILGADVNGGFIRGSFSSGGTSNLILNQTIGNVGIRTNTPAESLDVTGNIKLSGIHILGQYTTATEPAYVKGAQYFNTTLNKMKVGGETEWEILAYAGDFIKEIKTISADTYTLLAEDFDKKLHFTSATDTTVTLPTGLPLGNPYEGKQMGAGQVRFTNAVGVTLNKSATDTLKTADQYSVFGLDCTATDEYVLFGKLELE